MCAPSDDGAAGGAMGRALVGDARTVVEIGAAAEADARGEAGLGAQGRNGHAGAAINGAEDDSGESGKKNADEGDASRAEMNGGASHWQPASLASVAGGSDVSGGGGGGDKGGASATPRGGSVVLQFFDLTKDVDTFTGERKRVLHGVSGEAVPGEVLVLMGPSGSGKTTLLNSLHPERRGEHCGGLVTFNGYPMRKSFKRKIAYVLQEDLFYPGLTVNETLTFTARLRLSGTDASKRQAVADIVETLGLGKCAHSPIMLCSGGEKKRTSIATEMLTDPSLLLLDEPTSGLDSTTAAALVATLKSVARTGGRTVVASIHQPSSPVYASFDTVMLLCDGRTAYYGPPSGTTPYFRELGYACPSEYNPADFIMDMVNVPGEEGVKTKQAMIAAFAEGKCTTMFDPSRRGARAAETARDRAATLQGKSKSKVFLATFSKLTGRSGALGATASNIAPSKAELTPSLPSLEEAEEGSADTPAHASAEATPAKAKSVKSVKSQEVVDDEGPKWASSWALQTWILTQRSFRVAKGEVVTMLNLVQCLLLAVISGILWLRLDFTESQVNNRAGFIFFIFTFWPFQALFSALLTFPNERPILSKERASGSYRLSAYFWAKSFAEAPLRLIFPTLYQIISYWMVGVRDDAGVFFAFVVFQDIAVLTAESIGFWIGTAFFNMRAALVAASVIMLTLMLLGGFFIRNIPSWISWLRYLSHFKYANDAALGLVFDTNTPCDGSGLLPSCDNSAEGFATSSEVLDFLDVQGSVGFNVGLLIAMAVGLRCLAYLNLRFIKAPTAGSPAAMAMRR